MDYLPVVLPFINEAVKTFGLWSMVPVLLAIVVWETRRQFVARDAEIRRLRSQIEDLHAKRLQDAREMIRIAESSTAATAARTQCDQRLADLLETVLRKKTGVGPLGWKRS